MREINENRKLTEIEGRQHTVVRGWRRALHLENLPWLLWVFDFLLSVVMLKQIGKRNALETEVKEVEIELANLPEVFDGVRILFVSDIHLGEGVKEIAGIIAENTCGMEYDYCILGGDYNFEHEEPDEFLEKGLGSIVSSLLEKSRVFGVLGNHDRFKTAEVLDGFGVEMLMNDSVRIEREGASLYIAGIDDCHYYNAGDIGLACEKIEPGGCRIMVSHTPEPYHGVEEAGFDLCLCGHTHGGQVCLPGGVPLVANTTVPRRFLKGRWHYKQLQGYTSCGVGASGVAVRFFCRPEITVLTLQKKEL